MLSSTQICKIKKKEDILNWIPINKNTTFNLTDRHYYISSDMCPFIAVQNSALLSNVNILHYGKMGVKVALCPEGVGLGGLQAQDHDRDEH